MRKQGVPQQMSSLPETPFHSIPDDVLIDWTMRIAQLECEHTSFLTKLMDVVRNEEEEYFHSSPEEWAMLKSYGWLEGLSKQEALLGKSKLKPNIAWLLAQTVEVRVILHPPVPEEHRLYWRYQEALKTFEAHERGALSGSIL